MIRRLALFGAVLIGLLAVPATAIAAPPTPYPPGPPTMTVGATTVTVGAVVTINGSGFLPGEGVNITVTVQHRGLRAPGAAFVAAPTDQSVIASADGSFTARVELDTPGLATITATGATSGRSVSVQVTVLAPASTSTPPSTVTTVAGNQGGGGGLSYTGTNRTMIVLGAIGGVLAIVIGGGLVWLGVTRRPRRHTS